VKYAQKTADNSGLFLQNGQPDFVLDPATPSEFWPVVETVPFDRYITGWALVNGVCTTVTAPLNTDFRIRTLARIAARRYEIENAGVSVAVKDGTFTFDTARDNRANWLTMLMQLQTNPSFEMPNFKTNEGKFITLTAADIATIVPAGFIHVATAFGRENQLTQQLAVTADADLAAFDQTVEKFWP
jgi:hypothetical protein